MFSLNAQSNTIRLEFNTYQQLNNDIRIYERKGSNIFLVNCYDKGDVIHYTQGGNMATYKYVSFMGRTDANTSSSDTWRMNFDGSDIFFSLVYNKNDELIFVRLYFISSKTAFDYYNK